MEDLTSHYNGLSKANKEGPTFDLEEEMATLEYIIVAKFFTRRELNTKVIAKTSKPL